MDIYTVKMITDKDKELVEKCHYNKIAYKESKEIREDYNIRIKVIDEKARIISFFSYNNINDIKTIKFTDLINWE